MAPGEAGEVTGDGAVDVNGARACSTEQAPNSNSQQIRERRSALNHRTQSSSSRTWREL